MLKSGQRQSVVLPALLVAISVSANPAGAADFYAGKTIDLIISTSVGGGLDRNARIVANHLGNHIPGKPTIVPKNMPGAGHVRAANYLFTQAAKDGTALGTLIPAFVTAQVLKTTKAIQFDAAKFNWLGSTSSTNSTVYVLTSTGVATVEDARKKQVTMGATGSGSYTMLYPLIMNSVLGTRFKIVSGYKGGSEVHLAMERGEIEGRAGNNFSSLKAENGEWLTSRKITVITQVGLKRDPEFASVPLLTELAKSADDRAILKLFSADVVLGRPFLTPPGVPAERVRLLRKAFDEMTKDPAYIKDSTKSGFDVAPTSGEEIQSVVQDLIDTPAAVVERAKVAMQPKDVVKRSGAGGKDGGKK
jgi:tripartite-type tricarboxylate transporter receptor subunit TctC